MKHKITMAAAVVLLAWAGMTFSRAAAPAGTAAGAGQVKWEYKTATIPFTTGSIDECNHLGAEGWELVAVADHSQAGTECYFKRPK